MLGKNCKQLGQDETNLKYIAKLEKQAEQLQPGGLSGWMPRILIDKYDKISRIAFEAYCNTSNELDSWWSLWHPVGRSRTFTGHSCHETAVRNAAGVSSVFRQVHAPLCWTRSRYGRLIVYKQNLTWGQLLIHQRWQIAGRMKTHRVLLQCCQTYLHSTEKQARFKFKVAYHAGEDGSQIPTVGVCSPCLIELKIYSRVPGSVQGMLATFRICYQAEFRAVVDIKAMSGL